MAHSNICGGSTAKRVINCPGSVKLCQKMPPKVAGPDADRGTLLHSAIERVFDTGISAKQCVGMKYGDFVLDEDMLEDALQPAVDVVVNIIDPDAEMEFACEAEVGFGDLLPGVFGTMDLIGRKGNVGVIADYKFGNGYVDATENDQLLFGIAAALRTPKHSWAFDGVAEIECYIVQPACGQGYSKWVTTLDRVARFEAELVTAVKESEKQAPTLRHGEYCKWCNAKLICPVMTGAIDRALKTSLENIGPAKIDEYLQQADIIEGWIRDLRELALQMANNGVALPNYKLVAKRATRRWTNEQQAKDALIGMGLEESEITETALLSPAQAEKVLKKRKLKLPEDCVVAVSSGTTLVERSDPMPEEQQIGRVLMNALSKVV